MFNYPYPITYLHIIFSTSSLFGAKRPRSTMLHSQLFLMNELDVLNQGVSCSLNNNTLTMVTPTTPVAHYSYVRDKVF